MAKYYDTKGMGKSKICPKIKDEPTKVRHSRRKFFNFKMADTVGQFCSKYKIKLRITNRGHHWTATKDKKAVEWWPSSAKVVVNKLWQRGIHCHDYTQFMEVLKKQFKVEGE